MLRKAAGLGLWFAWVPTALADDGGQDSEWSHSLTTQPLCLLVRKFSLDTQNLGFLMRTCALEYEYAMTQKDALGGTAFVSNWFGMRTVGLSGEYSRYFLGDFGRGLRVSGVLGFGNTSGWGGRFTAPKLGLEVGGKYTFQSGVALNGDVGLAYTERFVLPALGFGVGYAF